MPVFADKLSCVREEYYKPKSNGGIDDDHDGEENNMSPHPFEMAAN